MVFTTIRIALVHRGRLGSHFVAFSVIVDIAERMITIWSFSPPVSGATRALPQGANGDGRLHPHRTARAGFEPRYVLLAVGSAAAGWLVLFVYAVWRSGGAAAAFTHSYIHCVTTYKFLLGTELDKVLAILAVTATLSLSLSLSLSLLRARKLLISSVAEERPPAISHASLLQRSRNRTRFGDHEFV